MVTKLTAFCDGSCSYKNRQGGVGVYLIEENGQEYFYKKGYSNTTISRMEIRALLLAITKVSPNIPVELNVYSDSEYVVLSFTEHRLQKWSLLNFYNVKNLELWYQLIDAINERPMLRLNMHHVRGHGKDFTDPLVYGNAVADLLADYKSHKDYKNDWQPRKVERRKEIDLTSRNF